MGTNVGQIAFAVEEFCRSARLSRSFFYRLCREGRGPATFKVGRRRFVRVAAAELWLKQQEERATFGKSCGGVE